MKRNTLLWMIIALAVLGAWAWYKARPPAKPAGFVTGRKLLEGFDPNLVTGLTLISGTQQVTLARTEKGWQVPARWNHPADFDRLSNLLRSLADLKVGDVLRGGTAHLADFGLSPEAATAPTVIRLTTAHDERELALGSPRPSSSPADFALPDSQFVRLKDGPVLLVAPYLDPLPAQADDWMDRNLLGLEPQAITSLEAIRTDGVRYGVRRDQDQFLGLAALDGQTISKEGADQWIRAWQALSCTGLADPASDRIALGLDTPDTIEVRTQDGMTFKAQLGRADARGDWPALFSVQWEPPARPEGLDEAARQQLEKTEQATRERFEKLQKRLSPWIFKLAGSTAHPLLAQQAQLMATPPAADAPASPAPETPAEPVSTEPE